MSNMREASKNTWASNSSVEHINCGSLQRIADATEKMAANYDQMRLDRDWQKARADRNSATNQRLRNRIAGLRGYIKRMKRGAT